MPDTEPCSTDSWLLPHSDSSDVSLCLWSGLSRLKFLGERDELVELGFGSTAGDHGQGLLYA